MQIKAPHVINGLPEIFSSDEALVSDKAMSEKNKGSASNSMGSTQASFLHVVRQLMPHVLLIIVYVFYLVIGGIVFSTLESESYAMLSAAEQAKFAQALRTKHDIMEAFQDSSNKSQQRFNISMLLDSLIDTVDHPDWKAGRKKVLMDGRAWSFPSAMLFAMTTITTIGYGDIVPDTVGGKSFCVVFSAIGVPFSFYLLGDIGQLLAIGFIRLFRWIRRQNCRGWAERRKERDSRVEGLQATRRKERDSRVEGLQATRRRTMDDHHGRGKPNITMRHLQSVRFPITEDTCPVDYRDWRTQHATVPVASSPQCVSTIMHDGDLELTEMETNASRDDKFDTNNSGLDKTTRGDVGGDATVSTVSGLHENHEYSKQRYQVKSEPISSVDNEKEAIQTASENAETDNVPTYEKDGDYHADEIPAWLVFLTLCSYICISAYAFSIVEGWDFGTSAYFTFITLTTIGFGDVVPNEQYTPARFIFCIAFTVSGLAVTSMCIALAQDRVSKKGKSLYEYLDHKLNRENSGHTTERDVESGDQRTG